MRQVLEEKIPAASLGALDDWSIPEDIKQHPFFVEVKTSMAGTLALFTDAQLSARVLIRSLQMRSGSWTSACNATTARV